MPLGKGEFVVFEQTPLSEYLKEMGEEDSFFPSPPPLLPSPSPPPSPSSPSPSPPPSPFESLLSSFRLWKKSSVEKLRGEKGELGSERCFEDYRCIIENWRLTVDGNVDYARKVKEEEVVEKVKKVIHQDRRKKQIFSLGGKEKVFLGALISLNVIFLRIGSSGTALALALVIAGFLYFYGFQKEIHCQNQVSEMHTRLRYDLNLCCAMTRLFENRLSKSIQIISEVELVARGYYLKSSSFSPIIRIERNSANRKCQRLREVTLSCTQALDSSFLQGTPPFTSSYPGIPLDPSLPTPTESVELLLSFSDRLSKRSTNSPPDCPPPLSTEELSGVDEQLSLSNLKETYRILQEHRAQFFDLIFLDAPLRRRKTGIQEATSSVETCQTFEILEGVEAWARRYLEEVYALNARLDHALNFQSEMSNLKSMEEKGKQSAEVVRLANLLKGLTKEIGTRLSLIQQEIFSTSEKNHNPQKFSEGVQDQLTHIEHNLKLSMTNFEELKKETILLLNREETPPSKAFPPPPPPSADPEPLPDQEEEKVFGDVEGEDLVAGEGVVAGREEVYEANPEGEEEEEEEVLKPKLSREERIIQRRLQQEEEKKKREAFQNKLDLVSELKNVLKQTKQK